MTVRHEARDSDDNRYPEEDTEASILEFSILLTRKVEEPTPAPGCLAGALDSR